MNYCPCCSGLLLEHLRGRQTYWFCRHCWQEMPVYNWNESNSFTNAVMGKVLIKGQKQELNNSSVYGSQGRSISEWIGLQEFSV